MAGRENLFERERHSEPVPGCVSNIEIVNLDEDSRRELLTHFPVGQVYNEKRLRLFLEKYQSVFKLHPDDPRLTERRLEEQTGAVSITLYACPCPVCY
jgi:hypothetical protein